MKATERAFLQGLAAGLAYVARNHGQDSLAEYGLKEMGVSLSDLVKAGVEPFDLNPIRRALGRRASAAAGKGKRDG